MKTTIIKIKFINLGEITVTLLSVMRSLDSIKETGPSKKEKTIVLANLILPENLILKLFKSEVTDLTNELTFAKCLLREAKDEIIKLQKTS